MTGMTIIVSFLIDLSEGHAYVSDPPGRQKLNSLFDVDTYGHQKGGPCGASNISHEQDNYNGPSSDYSKTKFVPLKAGGTFSMKIHFTVNHSGWHFAAFQCTPKGQAPKVTNKLGLAYASEAELNADGWKILRLSKNQPEAPHDALEYLTCDVWIPSGPAARFRTPFDFTINYDVPEDLGCADGEEGVVSWAWQANQNRCVSQEYQTRCGQAKTTVTHDGGNSPCGTPPPEHFETWYNCVDVHVSGTH